MITATKWIVALNHCTIAKIGGREVVMARIDKASVSRKNRDTPVPKKRLGGQ